MKSLRDITNTIKVMYIYKKIKNRKRNIRLIAASPLSSVKSVFLLCNNNNNNNNNNKID